MVMFWSDYGCYRHQGRWRETLVRVPRLVAVAAGWFGLTVALAAAVPGPGTPGSVAARPAAAGPAGSSVSALADVAVRPGVQQAGRVQANPPTTADCEKAYKVACYQPAQIQQAYNLPVVYANGVTGRGRTIVIVDSFGSPTIEHDLSVFDHTFKLPAPPSFKIIQPAGPIPPYDPNNSDMVGWAGETTLDVEYAHTIAPGANILLVETPVSETEGVHGFPQIVKAEEYVLSHQLGDVISQSFSATEETFRARPRSRRSAAPTSSPPGITSRCSPPRATRAPPTSSSTRPPTTCTR